jgi:hypothetical protein
MENNIIFSACAFNYKLTGSLYHKNTTWIQEKDRNEKPVVFNKCNHGKIYFFKKAGRWHAPYWQNSHQGFSTQKIRH